MDDPRMPFLQRLDGETAKSGFDCCGQMTQCIFEPAKRIILPAGSEVKMTGLSQRQPEIVFEKLISQAL